MKGDPLALRWPCPLCPKVFGTEWGQRIHLSLVHKGQTPPDPSRVRSL